MHKNSWQTIGSLRTDAFIIYPDRKGYIGINAYDWLDDESLYVYVSQEEELAAFTDFFMNRFATK